MRPFKGHSVYVYISMIGTRRSSEEVGALLDLLEVEVAACGQRQRRVRVPSDIREVLLEARDQLSHACARR